ncbi:HAD family hydrolase [uncultured Arcobacter sp.]|uniref:HAD family hydrolase n=1 Tax=uncultured Arcobacter sp. TaxID=165434 RepID=UPI00261FD9AE|nr:HAD family hydrolase [uncultured Arcobacter sp.]
MENIILFDLDGTLIDSTDAIVSTFHHSFEKMNFDFQGNDEDIKSLIGYPLEIMFMELGVEQELAWDFVDTYKQRYKTISTTKTLLLENAIEALEVASKFARLSIVTTKTGKYTIPLLEHFGILKYFEIVTGREHVENPKPHPEPILKTLEQMNLSKTSNIWMIGDTHLDILCANSAGVNSVAVLCGYGKEEDLKELTSFISKNSLEAVKLIEEVSANNFHN